MNEPPITELSHVTKITSDVNKHANAIQCNRVNITNRPEPFIAYLVCCNQWGYRLLISLLIPKCCMTRHITSASWTFKCLSRQPPRSTSPQARLLAKRNSTPKVIVSVVYCFFFSKLCMLCITWILQTTFDY